MFNDTSKIANKIETLVGEQCSILGNISGNGTIKIDGKITGDIVWKDDVCLGITSYVKGNISCANAYINGKVEGKIKCEDTLKIEEEGKVDGDIIVKKLLIEEGGILQGKCTMKRSIEAKNIPDMQE